MKQEDKWIRAIQRRGSRDAAEKLIQSYYDEIYRFIYRQVGHKEDAMDLTQSIFIAVLRAIPSYQAKRASFRTWLYRIAANKIIDARRHFTSSATGGCKTTHSRGFCRADSRQGTTGTD